LPVGGQIVPTRRPFPPASFSISYDQTLDKRPRAALQVKSGFGCLGVSPQGTAKSGKIAMEYFFPSE
jgi:hypothetical protein